MEVSSNIWKYGENVGALVIEKLEGFLVTS